MLYNKIALLRTNACHIPTTTVFLEDVCRASTVCAARMVVAGTSKRGAFGFERERHDTGILLSRKTLTLKSRSTLYI